MDNVIALLEYLETCDNHKDRHYFTKSDGDPDMDAARKFAENMREQLGSYLGDVVNVEQRNHAVDIIMLTPAHVSN